MDTRTATMRQVSVRAIGWLAIALLAVAALIGPAVRPTLAAHVITVSDTSLGEGFTNPCGSATALKIDEADLEAGTHTYALGDTGITVVLTTVFDGAEIDTVTVGAISGATFVIYVHAGEGTTLTLVEGLVINPDKGISFVLFCATVTTTTTTTSAATTETTTAVTTTETTTAVTTTETTTAATTSETTTASTTSGGVSSTTSANTTTASSGGVSGTTTMTLPPTSTVGPDSGSNSGLISFGLLLLALGGLVVTLASPMRRANNR